MQRIGLLGLATLALAGCGGGGSDGPTTPVNPPPAQIESMTLWKSFLAADRTYVTRGPGSDGAAYEITTAIRPKGSAQFGATPTAPLAAYNVVEVTNTVKRNDAAYSTTSAQLYIQPSDFAVTALVDPVAGTCTVPGVGPQSPVVPATAALNASGQFFNGEVYVYGTSTNRCFPPNGVLGAPRHSFTWSYEADAGRPLFCVNYFVTYPRDNRLQSTCFEVAGGNSLAGTARVTLSAVGLSITAKNY